MTTFSNPKFCILLIGLSLIIVVESKPQQPKNNNNVVYLPVGGFCAKPAAPIGSGGSWQEVESDLVKVCPPETTCRKVIILH